jgi:hypothetical protein
LAPFRHPARIRSETSEVHLFPRAGQSRPDRDRPPLRRSSRLFVHQRDAGAAPDVRANSRDSGVRRAGARSRPAWFSATVRAHSGRRPWFARWSRRGVS